ncbi:MAG: hypothetical protein WCK26_00940 [Candidatus Saccharibacteria bacterium]
MTHYLQSVLGVDSSLFSKGIADLEKSTGNSGVDTRIIADILEESHKVMRFLGLDTTDTTGHELYYSLMAAVNRSGSEIETVLTETDYALFVKDGQIISFNLIDVIENAHHEMPYKKQIISHGQRSLRGEIIGRYIDHKSTHNASTIDLVSSIGLLQESDAWYNNAKAYRKDIDKKPKESVVK